MRILTREMLTVCGVSKDDTVLCAFSGGADSTALLLSLTELLHEGALANVYAAHLNHGIRGDDADADQCFCETLCRANGITLFAERADVPAYAAENGLSLETAGRELRYSFLRRRKDACGADCIVTAHHRDDQAETVLMHLLRGCGTNGLAGIRPRLDDIAHPLLSVGRTEIEAYLRERGIVWRTDATNGEDAALRNRIRHMLLPLLDTFRLGAARAIADTASRVAEDEAYLSRLSAEAAKRICGKEGCLRKALADLPSPIGKRMIRDMLRETSQDVSEPDIVRVQMLLTAQTGTCIELSGGRSAWVDSAYVHIGHYPVPAAYETPFVREGITRLPHGTIFSERVTTWRKPENGNEQFLDADALPDGLLVRTRRDGDRFYPLGAPGVRKLSDVLSDKKIPLIRRDMPLLAAGETIFCVFGLTVSQLASIKPDTQHILHIVYKGEEE